MKKIAMALLLSVGLSAHAQWYTGTSQKTGLVLCIHLSDKAVDLYSPLQSSDPIPASNWSYDGSQLRFEVKRIGLSMDLFRRDSTFRGFWKQGMIKEDITLYPSDTLYQLLRPQTPQPPYRFLEETIVTDYTDSQGNIVHLEGSLTYPTSAEGPFPTLVLVSGSGQQNRDEEIMQHRPFLVLADYLASRGIAVLRYDDRGVGASTGPLDNADTRLFAEDAEAMFNVLLDNPHVDTHRVGIGGHSEGGAIAPMVAAKNKRVKYVVMLAGQGCTGLDVLLQQNEAIYRTMGLSDSLLAIRQACMRELFALPAGSSLKDCKNIISRHTATLSKTQIDSMGLGRGTASNFRQQLELPWMQSFLTLDPADYLPKVTCPVLAIGGEKDCQVLSEPNLQRIKTLCRQADCHTLTDLNHLFQHSTTGNPNEYMLIEETFATEAMKLVADWILALGR